MAIFKTRVAEPENLKTVPVPTFYLNTVPVAGHIHAYTYTYTYTYMCMSSKTHTYTYTKHILIQCIYMYPYIYIYTSVQIPICVRFREKEIIKLLIHFFEFFYFISLYPEQEPYAEYGSGSGAGVPK